MVGPPRQKAPSAIRCIKTARAPPPSGEKKWNVRKHRAPKGALRLMWISSMKSSVSLSVRKHRAPKGALRLGDLDVALVEVGVRQKAPSAKRCIKTTKRQCRVEHRRKYVRKHRAPKGALRRAGGEERGGFCDLVSESTERQKVH